MVNRLPHALATRQSLPTPTGCRFWRFCLDPAQCFVEVQGLTDPLLTVATSPVGTRDVDKRRCSMKPEVIFALAILLLASIPLLFAVAVLLFKVLLVLALSQDDNERKAALLALALGALKRR
jgi:hypothetical protein